jgi:hypothetical protein
MTGGFAHRRMTLSRLAHMAAITSLHDAVNLAAYLRCAANLDTPGHWPIADGSRRSDSRRLARCGYAQLLAPGWGRTGSEQRVGCGLAGRREVPPAVENSPAHERLRSNASCTTDAISVPSSR